MDTNAEYDKKSWWTLFGYLKNKLFVVGYENNEFEVFDNFCKKFVSPTHSPSITYSKCLPKGKKIVLVKNLVHQ